jgi:hypothetical protein
VATEATALAMCECEVLVELFKVVSTRYVFVGGFGAVAICTAEFDGLPFEILKVGADCRSGRSGP